MLTLLARKPSNTTHMRTVQESQPQDLSTQGHGCSASSSRVSSLLSGFIYYHTSKNNFKIFFYFYRTLVYKHLTGIHQPKRNARVALRSQGKGYVLIFLIEGEEVCTCFASFSPLQKCTQPNGAAKATTTSVQGPAANVRHLIGAEVQWTQITLLIFLPIVPSCLPC